MYWSPPNPLKLRLHTVVYSIPIPKEDIQRKTSTITGSVEGLLGLIDNSLIQQIDRYNRQCGWLTGGFNLGVDGEPAVSLEAAVSKQFIEDYYSLVEAATGVTENYHKEIEKWEREQYDDRKLVEITSAFLTEYDVLVDRASSIRPPQKYQEALDLYIKSLNSERSSYAVFRNKYSRQYYFGY
jgi:hypothetical protein